MVWTLVDAKGAVQILYNAWGGDVASDYKQTEER